MTLPSVPYRARLYVHLAAGTDIFPSDLIPYDSSGRFSITARDGRWPTQAISTGRTDVLVTAASDTVLQVQTFPASQVEGQDPAPVETLAIIGSWLPGGIVIP